MSTISTNVEIPQPLDDAVTEYLEKHPNWDRERFTKAAFSVFLMQNGSSDRTVNRTYLDCLFDERSKQ